MHADLPTLSTSCTFEHGEGLATDHREIHNVYGMLNSRATYEGLPSAPGPGPESAHRWHADGSFVVDRIADRWDAFQVGIER